GDWPANSKRGPWRARTAGGISTRPVSYPTGTSTPPSSPRSLRPRRKEGPSRADNQPAPGTVRQHLAGGRDPRTGPAGARPDRVSIPKTTWLLPVDRCTHPTTREKRQHDHGNRRLGAGPRG